MIARVCAVILAIALATSACAIQLTTALELGPPVVRLENSDLLYATRSTTMTLPRGETVLRLPLDALDVSPGDAMVEVQPAERVTLVGARTLDDPSETLWRVRADREVEAAISLTYPVEGLSWAITYAVNLGSGGEADIQAALRVSNELGRDLREANLIGDIVNATISLDDGESITVQQPLLSGTVVAEDIQRQIVYDRDRYGDAAMELLKIAALPERDEDLSPDVAPARLSGPLPGGSVRIYTAAAAGPEFISESSVPYTPAGESMDLRLGPASGVTVTRSLDDTSEVDKRLDARDRVALYDLLETWILEVRNLRERPVALQIRQSHDGYWKVERSSHDYERPCAESLFFELTVDTGERAEITYRLRHFNREP